MTESVALEFEMIPSQNELAVLPESIDELFIDLRVQGDVVGLYTPEMEVKLIIGKSVTTLNSDQSSVPVSGGEAGHRWIDEPLNPRPRKTLVAR